MEKKIVRVYFSTFVDVELSKDDFDEEDWEDESTLTDYAEYNIDNLVEDTDQYVNNMEIQPLETAIIDEYNDED